MEEGAVELSDYIRVVWKRKILIIVGTLVCIVAGVAMSLRSPTTCRAEVLIRVGKNIASYDGSRLTLIETLVNRSQSIPFEYANADTLGYSLGAKGIPKTDIVSVNLGGATPGKVKELLRKVVERIIADDNKVIDETIKSLENLIERCEVYITKSEKEFDYETLMVEKMIRNEYKDASGDDGTRFLLFNTIQNNLANRREHIMSAHAKNFKYKLIIKDLVRNKARIVGVIKETIIRKSKSRYVLKSGFIGLTVSVFLAFFIEYMGNVRKTEKRESMS
jgi:capsular polysaccharide biosynthesis protein